MKHTEKRKNMKAEKREMPKKHQQNNSKFLKTLKARKVWNVVTSRPEKKKTANLDYCTQESYPS
jgi:hypothetical protein